MESILKKIFVLFFAGIIIMPMFLQIASKLLQKDLDISINGYFDTYEKEELTIDSFVKGEYQVNYENWLNNNLMPRNVYIKLYNQIQYSLFDLSNRLVGKNEDIFEYDYIKCELCLDGVDYSIPEKDAEMDEYINTLCEVNEKLERVGKKLIVYTTPSKAHWHIQNVPECYKIQAVDGVRGIDSFRKKVADTGVKYIDTEPIIEQSTYPAFYNTGIHWARTVEEQSSVAIINEMKELTGKNYRNITLGNVQESDNPFWRDSDVYDLANLIFSAEKTKYYQYDIDRQFPNEFDKLRLLLQGGSFANGLINDYFNTYSGDEVYYINYSSYVLYDNNEVHQLETWDDIDLQYLLDQTDVVAIEMNEHHVPSYSNGFAEYLNSFLDDYIPNLSEMRVADSNLDPVMETGLTYCDGYYGYETGHVWAQKDSSVTLRNNNITEQGLELQFSINENVILDGEDEIFVYVNQKLVKCMKICSTEVCQIYISPEELCKINTCDTYDIEIICTKDFNPSVLGLSSDNRDLAIDIMYIGEAR